MCITFKLLHLQRFSAMNSPLSRFWSVTPSVVVDCRIALVVLFIIFGYPKLTGFSGTVQYMTSLRTPMPMLAAIIAVVMRKCSRHPGIVLGFHPTPSCRAVCVLARWARR